MKWFQVLIHQPVNRSFFFWFIHSFIEFISVEAVNYLLYLYLQYCSKLVS